MPKRIFIFFVIFGFIALPVFADTVCLKTGQKREGKIIEKTKDYLKMDFYGSTLVYFADEVESVNSLPFEKYSSVSSDIDSELLEAGMLRDPYPGGIYNLDGVTVKINAPKGWKIISNEGSSSVNSVQFIPPGFGVTGLRISVVTSEEFAKNNSEQYLRQMMDAAKDDPNVLVQEIIPFANTKALSSLSLIGGMKTRQIQFYDKTRLFTITFVTESKDYDALYPLVADSISTFSLIRPVEASSTDTISQTQGLLTPSDELLDRFQTIFEGECLESVNEFKKMSNAGNRPGAETNSVIEMMKKECCQFMDKYSSAFILSDEEAKKILSADYDFSDNKEKIKGYINQMMTVRQRLPMVIEYLMQKYYQNKLSGLESEFTLRLFGEYLKDFGVSQANQ